VDLPTDSQAAASGIFNSNRSHASQLITCSPTLCSSTYFSMDKPGQIC
jgi:hypothetical protein